MKYIPDSTPSINGNSLTKIGHLLIAISKTGENKSKKKGKNR